MDSSRLIFASYDIGGVHAAVLPLLVLGPSIMPLPIEPYPVAPQGPTFSCHLGTRDTAGPYVPEKSNPQVWEYGEQGTDNST